MDTELFSTFTANLDKILSFPQRFLSYNKPIREIFQCFITALRDDLGLVSTDLYCLYRYTNRLERAVCSEEGLPLQDVGRLWEILSSDNVLEEPAADGAFTIYVPLFQQNTDGRQFEHESQAGQGPFRKWGVLVVASARAPEAQFLSLLRLAGAQLVHASEMYELLHYQQSIVDCLGQSHQISMNAVAAGDVSELFRIVRNSEIVGRMFDGMAIWLHREGESFSSAECHATENVRSFDISSVHTRVLCYEPLELYDIDVGNCHSVMLCPLMNINNFFGVIGFFRSYKRMLRSDERAAAIVLSQQVANSIESILLHKNLEIQNLALKYEKDFSEKIFASINSGIIVIDDSGKILTANPYALHDLEMDAADITDMFIEEVIPGILSAASGHQREGVFTLKSGKTVYLGFNISSLKGNDGLSGSIILFRDITEIMNLRKELRRKEYFSTIGRMGSWIAHEVRNPVFAISSIAAILKKQAKDPEQEKFISSILKEANTLNLLVDDLLMYGKALELKTKRVMIQDFLKEITDGMASIAGEFGGEFRIVRDGEGLHAVLDTERMKQVFYNLIKNALEADASLVTIDVCTEDETIIISIQDDGKGIKNADITQMFTPFFTTKKSGTGLGLSICRKIVDEHGGSIRISSESTSGAVVQIALKAV